MTTREEAGALVRRMLDCFNSRQFDQADGLFAPAYLTHPGGTVGFEAGKEAWRRLVARHPGIRVVPREILLDGDRATVRSTVEGVGTPQGEAPPELIEIFRIEDGRFAEWWGSTWHPRLD
ncbi:ester cyclase [Streptomyces hoynatensis]|uniref:Nuclear transport factor 2 family protein n=1 Tax=Streptomyces hoynatensis TaxID=1141874 RepID=A0A3A9YXS0_9ACTN|nr:nuclear transport factor 2 family protein [Streptomyces hoynatensis]RKN40037.1 nuclear transport factor 2 family protein [Streptomyces hoynatensis]